MPEESIDVHKVFADFFPDERIRPFAYFLSRRLKEGHICMPVDTPQHDSSEVYPVPSVLPDFQQMKTWVNVDDADPMAPFVLRQQQLYLQRYYQYEINIANKITELVHRGRSLQEERKKILTEQADRLQLFTREVSGEGLTETEKINWQEIAVVQSFLHDISIITGGPGTGKTTTLSNLLRLIFLTQPNATIALAAPTGKASMRMLQSLNSLSEKIDESVRPQITALKSFTIHSLLGYQRHSLYFKYNETNPLPYDWIIVDEASMIDLPLFAKLLMAMGGSTRLVLLGDKDQLASVEAGSLFGDLCQSLPALNQFSQTHAEWLNQLIRSPEHQIPDSFITPSSGTTPLLQEQIVELKLSYRFKERGKIGQLSKAILHQQTATVDQLLNDPSKEELDFRSPEDTSSIREFVKGYGAYLQEKDPLKALSLFNTLRVLVAVKKGESGLYKINQKIEKILADEFGEWFCPEEEFYANRPVMITRNNYELGLFNGDIGILRPDEQGRMRAWFADEKHEQGIRAVLPAYLSGCETVFAMTIHKSQGSEFDHVMVVLPEQEENRLLTRELIYTGITRAKSRVVLLGKKEVLFAGMIRSVERSSGLPLRLQTSTSPTF